MLRSRRFLARLSPQHFSDLFDGVERPIAASALLAPELSAGATIRPALSAQQRANSAAMFGAAPVRKTAALAEMTLPRGVVARRRTQYRPLASTALASELALDAYLVILEFDRDRLWTRERPDELDGQPVPELLTHLRPMPRCTGAATPQPDLGPPCRGIGVTDMRAILDKPETAALLEVIELDVPHEVVGSERRVKDLRLAHPVVVHGGPGISATDAEHGLKMIGLLSAKQDAATLALGGAIWDCQNVTVRLTGYAGATELNIRSPAQLCVALVEATESLPAGATICIPIQFEYELEDGTKFNMPVESDEAVFNAIKRATGLGLHVVVASGNNNAWILEDVFEFTETDSGSIMCGYADEPEPSETQTDLYLPLDENRPQSNRINCHTCGENVPTLGAGALAATGGSSASTSLISSIVSTLQSIHWLSSASTSTSITPSDMRTWLSTGCSPWYRGTNSRATGQIGVLPNLASIATEHLLTFSLVQLLVGPAFATPTAPEQAITLYGTKRSHRGRFVASVFNATNTAYAWAPWPRTPASATWWKSWWKIIPAARRLAGRPPWANTNYRLHFVIAELPDGSFHWLENNADLAAIILRWRALIGTTAS